MDHHCKFVNNCIGYRNYKYFMVFLFYCTILCMFLLVTMIEGITFYIHDYGWETIDCKLFFAGYVYIFFIFVAVIDLYIFHIGILCKGHTTIENKDTKLDIVFLLIYLQSDLSTQDCLENFKEIMGENYFLWIFPFSIQLFYIETTIKYGGYYFENMKEATEANTQEAKQNHSKIYNLISNLYN